MVTAERDGKFVADLASERSRLGKFEVVGVAGRALADNTGLGRNEGEVGFVPPDTVVNAEVFHQAREPFAMFDDLMHMAQHRRMILLREISVRREFAKRAKRSSNGFKIRPMEIETVPAGLYPTCKRAPAGY